MTDVVISNETALELLAAQLKQLFAALLSGKIQAEHTKIPFSFVLSGFGEDSSLLTPAQESILEQLSFLLFEDDAGISDNQLIRAVFEIDELIGRASQTGAETNNIQLSRERAEAVRDWMADNGLYALPAIIYHGSSDPLVDSSRNELEINRSVEVRILVSIDIEPLEQTLDHWEAVFLHQVPETVVTALDDRDIVVQSLGDANSIMSDPKLNLDYYQVRITEMPKKPDGSAYDMTELFREIRLNLSDIISSLHSKENPFKPDLIIFDEESEILGNPVGVLSSIGIVIGAHASFQPYQPEDADRWNSDEPLGAVMQFDSFFDDMGVVCSAFAPDFWIFTTVGDSRVPGLGAVGTHPVSGNRKFGYRQEGAGHHIVYTMGADRTTSTFETALGPLVFGGGHIIWLSWQVGIHRYITERGGKAEILRPLSNRSSYEEALVYFYQ